MQGGKMSNNSGHNGGGQAGLSLVEVLVSLAITLLLGGAVLHIFCTGLENASAARQRAAATVYAASILEACQARSAEWVGDGFLGVSLAPEQLGLSVPKPQGFTAQVRVEGSGYNEQIWRVDTTVYWTEEGGTCQEILTGLVRRGTV